MKRRMEGITIIVVAAAIMVITILVKGLDTPMLLFLLLLAAIGLGISVVIDGNKAVQKPQTGHLEEEIVDSHKLHDEMNEERKKEGKEGLQAINAFSGISTNNLARKDKSWSSVPDFFYKMISKKDKEKQ